MIHLPKHRKAYMVRYADDSVFCFQYKEDALVFYEALESRGSVYSTLTIRLH